MSGTYFARGQWNAVCDRCGGEFKSGQLQRTWDGLMVCSADWEPRHPQDFVRSPRPEQPPPWTRPGAANTFISVCTPNGTSCFVDFGVVECLTVDFVSPLFDPEITN